MMTKDATSSSSRARCWRKKKIQITNRSPFSPPPFFISSHYSGKRKTGLMMRASRFSPFVSRPFVDSLKIKRCGLRNRRALAASLNKDFAHAIICIKPRRRIRCCMYKAHAMVLRTRGGHSTLTPVMAVGVNRLRRIVRSLSLPLGERVRYSDSPLWSERERVSLSCPRVLVYVYTYTLARYAKLETYNTRARRARAFLPFSLLLFRAPCSYIYTRTHSFRGGSAPFCIVFLMKFPYWSGATL